MAGLKRGLFWLSAASNLGAPPIDALIEFSNQAYRDVLILTDLPVSAKSSEEVVRVNDDPGHKLDYIVLADSIEKKAELLQCYKDRLNPSAWICWMLPRPASATPFPEAHKTAQKLLARDLSAVYVPQVSQQVGGTRDIIFTPSAAYNILSPLSAPGLWSDIFRATEMFS